MVLVQFLGSGVGSAQMNNFPAPFTSHNRVLGMVCSYNMDHMDSLYLILGEYVAMCEGGFLPTIVLFTTASYTPPVRRVVKYRTWCYRANASLTLVYKVFEPSISINLASQHRRFMTSEVNNYDVFIYHEDDMIVKFHQLVGFLAEIRRLQTLIPDTALRDNTIGFLRYRRLPSAHGYSARDVVEQELMDEEPNFSHICIANEPYLQVTGNMHQAMWIFTQDHINILQEKCNFLNHSSASREFMSSFGVFDKKPHHCGLNKLLPGLNFHSYFIQHYYQSKFPHWWPVLKATDNLLAGRHAQQDVGEPALPECWKEVANLNRQFQWIPPPPTAAPIILIPTVDNATRPPA